MIRINLAAKLGELRWKQIELARATDIRPGTINDYYWELVDKVSLRDLDLICEALNCEISEILIRVPDGTPSTIRTKTGRKRKSAP